MSDQALVSQPDTAQEVLRGLRAAVPVMTGFVPVGLILGAYGGTCRALALHLGLHRNAARKHLTSGSRGQGISKIVSTSCTASVADQAFSGFLIERPPASRQREWNPSSSTSSRPSANSRAASSTAGRSRGKEHVIGIPPAVDDADTLISFRNICLQLGSERISNLPSTFG